MSDFSVGFDDEYVFSDDSFETQDEKKKTDKVTKIVKVIVGLLIIFLLVEIVIFKFINPSNSVPRVNITGNESYTTEELADYLRPMNCNSYYDFDVDQALSILSSISGIREVSIRKSFPDKIYITVEERKPVALTFVNVDGHSVPLQIDEDGILFPERVRQSVDGVPIISGIPVEYLNEGMRIPEKYRSLITQICELSKLPYKYFSFISEICVIPKEYGNYELVLIPVKSKVKVLTDRSLNQDALSYMMIALDVANSIEPDVSEIDLRYGSVSFRK